MKAKDTTKAGTGLSEDLPELLALDRLRTHAKKLQSSGTAALLDLEDAWENSDSALKNDWATIWERNRNPITRMLVRRVIQRSANMGQNAPDYTWKPPEVVLEAARGGDPYQAPEDEPGRIHISRGELSIFSAAEYMRTCLDELGEGDKGGLSEDLFKCFYVVVRELYTAEKPDWALGGAKIGAGSSPTTMFATMECARSIGYFAQILQNTAEFIDHLREHDRYVWRIERSRDVGTGFDKKRNVLPLDDQLCLKELARVRESLISLLYEYDGKTVLRLDKRLIAITKDGSSTTTILQNLKNDLRSFITNTIRNLGNDKHRVKGDEKKATGLFKFIYRHRKNEDDWVKALEAKYGGLSSLRVETEATACRRSYNLSQTAHDHIVTNLERTAVLLSSQEEGESDMDFWKRMFRTAATEVHSLLEPVKSYVTGAMKQLLVGCEEHSGAQDLQELIFASICAGSISQNWSAPVYSRIASLLHEALDSKGRLPLGPPFFLGSDDDERYPINAHTIREMAHLFMHMDHAVDLRTVERMVRYFDDGVTPLGDPKRLAWKRLVGHEGQKCSPWVSAVSVMALDRIVRMLDHRINAMATRHFVVKRSSDLKNMVRIDGLMCSDIGLASLTIPHRPSRNMLTHDMERLRRHLSPKAKGGVGATRSMILYGPPGTGKTTLVESMAATAGAAMVTITPGDFLVGGAEGVEHRAQMVMTSLSLLTRVVVLFDEFDSVISDRERQKDINSVFAFLTGGMLPKLADLSAAAKRNHFVYVLATNYIDRLDSAAIRPGRFDDKRGVYPPDMESRMCRLVSELIQWQDNQPVSKGGKPHSIHDSWSKGWEGRAARVVARTAGVPMERLMQSGWFKAPGGKIPRGSAWDYIAHDSPEPAYPLPADAATAKSDFKNELEIDQAYELAIVGCVNLEMLKHAEADGERFVWGDLMSKRPEHVTNALIDRWRKTEERVRETRIARMAVPPFSGSAASYEQLLDDLPTAN